MTGNTQRLQLSYPLLHLLLHGLIRAHDRLLVDDYFRRVGTRSADAGSDGRSVCVDDDSEKCNLTLVLQQIKIRTEREESTHPSSIVSSKHNSTKSKFSSTPLFSNELRRSMVSASVRDVSAAEIIKSFSVGPAMK